MTIINLYTHTALYHTAQYLSGQLQLYKCSSNPPDLPSDAKKAPATTRPTPARHGSALLCLLPGSLLSQAKVRTKSPCPSSAWVPPVLSFLPSFLTHGFPVPSLHRPKQKKTGSLFVFGLVILQPRPLICPFVSFAARCFDRGSSSSLTLSLPVSYRHF